MKEKPLLIQVSDIRRPGFGFIFFARTSDNFVL